MSYHSIAHPGFEGSKESKQKSNENFTGPASGAEGFTTQTYSLEDGGRERGLRRWRR